MEEDTRFVERKVSDLRSAEFQLQSALLQIRRASELYEMRLIGPASSDSIHKADLEAQEACQQAAKVIDQLNALYLPSNRLATQPEAIAVLAVLRSALSLSGALVTFLGDANIIWGERISDIISDLEIAIYGPPKKREPKKTVRSRSL